MVLLVYRDSAFQSFGWQTFHRALLGIFWFVRLYIARCSAFGLCVILGSWRSTASRMPPGFYGQLKKTVQATAFNAGLLLTLRIPCRCGGLGTAFERGLPFLLAGECGLESTSCVCSCHFVCLSMHLGFGSGVVTWFVFCLCGGRLPLAPFAQAAQSSSCFAGGTL